MTTIQDNIRHLRDLITESEQKFGRQPQSVQLLAVSKTKPISAIERAITANQTCFGENYVQEGIEKVDYFRNQHPNLPLTWHFIGPIQSNKTRPVAERFDWVHTIDREKIAKRLNDQRPPSMPPLNVLIQVNISMETAKSGVTSQEILPLAHFIASQPNLNLRGLMSIPANVDSYEQQKAAFLHLSEQFKQLQSHYPQVDTLSMGMSGDMQAAIECGSTIVRIGTALFGARDYR